MGVTTIQRRQALRAMLRRAEQSGDSAAPWTSEEALGEHFDGEDDVLVGLHQEWIRLLSARLHRGQIVARRNAITIRDIYDDLCAEHATMRRILDAHQARPSLWEPTAREHALLARVGGLVDDEETWEDAATLGRTLLMQRVPVQRGALG